ncbi:citramalate synthase [Thermodesulfobacterium sp. TA1]|uniref:citramalate synthase n=1 Tax=Thermodesulfobacterium sp. TA1 TaxID=2234087 RepID=UPI001232DF58|nr:citramalate synthase [Thermodesulfobacterium sp. TA1]QER41440.1 citramalate synthase [Thermodesulfobacterium sp. TA1]
MKRIEIYDTTLRDGSQAEEINFSLEDKIRIVLKLDEFKIDYIEGGWPGSNPKDFQFFKEIKDYHLKHAKIVAFGSTYHPKKSPETDEIFKQLLQVKVPVVTIFGKSWTIHVKEALKISLEQNLELIANSIRYLKPHVEKVFYDAEHFFDGFKADPQYALATLKKAKEAGADCLILCDTNGGTLPYELAEIIKKVKEELGENLVFGIHAHNDSECAVANSLEAVRLGATQVQGTINGIGERCGNANLCSIIPNLVLKMGYTCSSAEVLYKLTEVSKYVFEMANLSHPSRLPFVGRSAFAHKGGVHVSAVLKSPSTYEHIDPVLVGNTRRVLVSELSGKSNIIYKAKELGIDLELDSPLLSKIVEEIKKLEAEGFEFEAAEASLELLIYRLMGEPKQYFELLSYKVFDFKSNKEGAQSEATVIVRVPPGVGEVEHTAALGNGPVNALDNALRKALERFYPQIKEMELEDYKVRVLPGLPGTSSKVRVFILSKSKDRKWGTVGVSTDILEASCQALIDSYTYKLFLDKRKK